MRRIAGATRPDAAVPSVRGRSNLPLFPASEHKTLLLTVLAHTAVIVTLFAFQKYLETS